MSVGRNGTLAGNWEQADTPRNGTTMAAYAPSRRRAVGDAVSAAAAAASAGAAFVLLPHPTRGEGEMSGE